MSSSMDLYKVLDVASDASPASIKKAYLVGIDLNVRTNDDSDVFRTQELVKVYFPDRAPEGKKEEYTARFIAIKEAVDILLDPKKRNDYDRSRAPIAVTPSPRPAARPPPSPRPSVQRPDARPATPASPPKPQSKSWQPPQKATVTYTPADTQPRAIPNMSSPIARWLATVDDRDNPAQQAAQIPLPPSWPSLSPQPPQQQFRPPPPPSIRVEPGASRPQNPVVTNDNPFNKIRGRYYPHRDLEHLEYVLPVFGPIKRKLSESQMDILKLMLLAFRNDLNVVEYPFLKRSAVLDLKDRFAFDWKGKPFGVVEVRFDQKSAARQDADGPNTAKPR